MKRFLFSSIALFGAVACLFAQEASISKTAVLRSVRENPAAMGVQANDLKELAVQDVYVSRHNGITHAYVQQGLNGRKIYKAVSSIHFNKQGIPVHRSPGFIHDLSTVQDLGIMPVNALLQKAGALHETDLSGRVAVDITGLEPFRKQYEPSKVYTEQVYALVNAQLRNALLVIFQSSDGNDWWNMLLDAANGNLLEEHNWTLHCAPVAAAASGSYNYRVFNLPSESPNHGNRVTLINSPDDQASPFGWHDTDGIAGSEYSVTRGNNAYASEDADANNRPGYSPDGGASLLFDYPWDSLNSNPVAFRDFAITNLFVANNTVHDVMWRYGFDEPAGNFQVNNYGRGGLGGDEVFADAQDGSGTNNANFATPPDGTNPRMQMYIWKSGGSSNVFEVLSPSSVKGRYTISMAGFGPRLTATPITGKLVWVNDGSANPSRGCSAIQNTADLQGNIAVIDRGDCIFPTKVLNAQNAGAKAVIVVNNQAGNPFAMSGSGAGINIPAMMISQANGTTLSASITAGTATATLYDSSAAGKTFDSDLDHGVIAHEYGHGVSTRLTCGPANSSGLTNDEQMGEGWSDFFSLSFTVRKGDIGSSPRGIGTYLLGQPVTGAGIRTYPYSTNMTVNPHTYNNISKALSGTRVSPHYVGEIWCSMLWDLYWNMVARDGFDENLTTGKGGNNTCIQLVVDGMKLQKCNPGFIDARNAILKADSINNKGANSGLIWETFARRGLGFKADQGNEDDVTDGTQDFSIPGTTGLQQVQAASWRIFPNPANDVLYLEPLNSRGAVNVRISDLSGRVVLERTFSKSDEPIMLDINSLSNGMYLLQTGQGTTLKFQVMK
jgi:hypothetical protein